MTARAELILSLRGNLVDGLERASRQFQRTQQVGSRSMAVLNRSVLATSRGFDRLANRYSALFAGAAAGASARFALSHERRLTRLGIAADLSAEQVAELNRRIYENATAPDVRVDSSEILSAIEAIVEKTGDLEFARNNLRNIALSIQATGAGGVAIGELLAEFQKLGEVDGSKVLRLLDTLNVQGKAGAFTLQNLAALGPRVITAYAGSVKGLRDNATVMREMGAALQTIRQGTGSSEQAATAFERLLADLQAAEKQKLFRKLGVQVFTLGADGQKALRPINELMGEIVERTRGDRTVLGSIFGDESIRAFNAFRPDLIQQYMDVMGDGTATMRDSARAASDAAGALQNLSTAWRQFADTNLTPAIQDLASGLSSITPETVQYWGDLGKKVLIVGGGLIALRKIFQLGRGIGGILGVGAAAPGGGFAGAAAGGALGGVPVPLPVFVVNKRMSLLPGALGDGAAAGGAAGGAAASRASRLARFGRAAGGVGLAAGVGYGVGSLIYNTALEDTRLGDAIGAGIARVLAAFGNRTAQDAVEAQRRAGRAEAELTGSLRIQIDGPARVTSATTSQPGVDLEVHSGLAGAPS